MQATLYVMFMQMHAKKGIKLFGERGIAGMIKELKQLYQGVITGKSVVIPLNPDDLTDAERRQALEAGNLIQEKRNGIIKGRTCANGNKQNTYLREGEIVASPMVSLEGLFTMLVINAYKGR